MVGPALGVDVGPMQVIVAELICTFALATVVLNMATAKKTEGHYAYGCAIGLTVTVRFRRRQHQRQCIQSGRRDQFSGLGWRA